MTTPKRRASSRFPVDPDGVPRTVVTTSFGFTSGAQETEFHEHRKAQLLYSRYGVMKCEAEQGLWMVPPQCAVWIPPNTRHNVKSVKPVSGYCLFVEPDALPSMPRLCSTISVSPLLRELLVRCVDFPILYPLKGREARLVSIVLDELSIAPVEKLHLPMPTDLSLRRLADMMMADASNWAKVSRWAENIGMSERSLNRHFRQEIGMSLGRWRQQMRIILAIQMLSQKKSVKFIADELGYEDASSFVTMFRKILGTSPARYMTQRVS
jgi:AraC-like DNA-binding protein